jgi:hypothetical protein
MNEPLAINLMVAGRLEEVAGLLRAQHANPYRVRAYEQAAMAVRSLELPVSEILSKGGTDALLAIPSVGENIARSIRDLVLHGRLPMLERMRGESDPIALLETVPGIGPKLADRLHHDLGIESLEELEVAAWDGRLERSAGIRGKRLASIRELLEHRLARARREREANRQSEPEVAEILDVDREYREKAAAGSLPCIAPRRFNPTGTAWLPVLHAQRGDRHYTVLFSNTPRAHALEKTHDWVIVYYDWGREERQSTVITAEWGMLEGRRIVRGREGECAAHYARGAPSASPPSAHGERHDWAALGDPRDRVPS